MDRNDPFDYEEQQARQCRDEIRLELERRHNEHVPEVERLKHQLMRLRQGIRDLAWMCDNLEKTMG